LSWAITTDAKSKNKLHSLISTLIPNVFTCLCFPSFGLTGTGTQAKHSFQRPQKAWDNCTADDPNGKCCRLGAFPAVLAFLRVMSSDSWGCLRVGRPGYGLFRGELAAVAGAGCQKKCNSDYLK